MEQTWIDKLEDKLEDARGKGKDPFKEVEEDYKLPRDYLSVSQVKRWIGCGEQYRRKYINEEEGPRNATLVRGGAIHEIVEQLVEFKIKHGEMPGQKKLEEYIHQNTLQHLKDIDEWDDKVENEQDFKDSVEALSWIYYEQRLPDVDPRFVEKKIRTKLRGRIPFLGYVDLIEKTDETKDIETTDSQDAESLDPNAVPAGDIITDLKVSSRKKSQKDVDNSLQLSMYALIGGVKKVAFDNLVETRSGNRSFNRITSTRPDWELEHAANVVEEAALSIQKGVFPKTTPGDWRCSKKWCMFWDVCRGRNAPEEPNKEDDDE